MKRPTVAIACILALAATAAHAQSSSLSDGDRSFAKQAAAAGIGEVDEAQIALQQGNSQSVKDFAQHMVTDHTKANDQLKQIAQKEGLTLPPTASAADQKEAAALSKKSGAAFDSAYVKDQLAAHKKAVSLFSKESKSGKDPVLKDFATQTLPILEGHLKMATALSQKGTSPAM